MGFCFVFFPCTFCSPASGPYFCPPVVFSILPSFSPGCKMMLVVVALCKALWDPVSRLDGRKGGKGQVELFSKDFY